MISLGDTFRCRGLMWEVIEVLNYKVIAVVINGEEERAFMKEEVEGLLIKKYQGAHVKQSLLEPGTYLVTLEVTTTDTLHMNVDEGEGKTIGELIEETVKALEGISPDPIIKCRATRITKATGAPVYSDD